MTVALTLSPDPPVLDGAFLVIATGLEPGRWYQELTIDGQGTEWNGALVASGDGTGSWPCQPVRYAGAATVVVQVLPDHGHKEPHTVATEAFSVH